MTYDLQNRASASAAACGMECGVAAPAGGYPAPPAHSHPALSPTERSPAKSGLHVNFSDKGEVSFVYNALPAHADAYKAFVREL